MTPRRSNLLRAVAALARQKADNGLQLQYFTLAGCLRVAASSERHEDQEVEGSHVYESAWVLVVFCVVLSESGDIQPPRDPGKSHSLSQW